MQSLSHWTTREVPVYLLLSLLFSFCIFFLEMSSVLSFNSSVGFSSSLLSFLISKSSFSFHPTSPFPTRCTGRCSVRDHINFHFLHRDFLPNLPLFSLSKKKLNFLDFPENVWFSFHGFSLVSVSLLILSCLLLLESYRKSLLRSLCFGDRLIHCDPQCWVI